MSNITYSDNDGTCIYTLDAQEYSYRKKFKTIFTTFFSNADDMFCTIYGSSKRSVCSSQSCLLALPECKYSAEATFTNEMFLCFMDMRLYISKCSNLMTTEIFSKIFLDRSAPVPKYEKMSKIIKKVKRSGANNVEFDFVGNNLKPNHNHKKIQNNTVDQPKHPTGFHTSSSSTQTHREYNPVSEKQKLEISLLRKNVLSLEKTISEDAITIAELRETNALLSDTNSSLRKSNSSLKDKLTEQDVKLSEIYDFHCSLEGKNDRTKDKFPEVGTRDPNHAKKIHPKILKTCLALTAQHKLPSNLVNPVLQTVANTCFDQHWEYKPRCKSKISKRKDTPFDDSDNASSSDYMQPKKMKHNIGDNILPSHSYANKLDKLAGPIAFKSISQAISSSDNCTIRYLSFRFFI